ncbi:hypothetical protein GCM10022254_05200 [Actinomadura meridiana]|uniref:DUF397 domain-containing protein n=1 Tax=Actinomadura meridiana TaxID=559626 RepID=A0ABP8BSS0_9ACTN
MTLDRGPYHLFCLLTASCRDVHFEVLAHGTTLTVDGKPKGLVTRQDLIAFLASTTP